MSSQFRFDASVVWHEGFGAQTWVRLFVESWNRHATCGLFIISKNRRWPKVGRPSLALDHETIHSSPTLCTAVFGTKGAVVCWDLRFLDRPADFPRRVRYFRSLVWRATYIRARTVISISDETRQRLLHHWGIDSHVVTVVEEARGKTSTDRCGYLAVAHRLNKHPDHVINAFANAFGTLRPPVTVVCGQIRPSKKPVGSLELRCRLSADEYAAKLATVRAVVILSEYEGLGLPVLEAMARAIPIVATELPSIRELVGPDYPLSPSVDSPFAAEMLAEIETSEEYRSMLSSLLVKRQAEIERGQASQISAVKGQMLGPPSRRGNPLESDPHLTA
jgi:glycosyltransferase involved in cell wall biosynthesis